jgi:hypothetical protein
MNSIGPAACHCQRRRFISSALEPLLQAQSQTAVKQEADATIKAESFQDESIQGIDDIQADSRALVNSIKVGSLEWLALSAKGKWHVACRTVKEVRP